MLVVSLCFAGHCVRETPGYIPNPEAKPFSADGTAGGTLWESRTPPNNCCGSALYRLVQGISAFRTQGTTIPFTLIKCSLLQPRGPSLPTLTVRSMEYRSHLCTQ